MTIELTRSTLSNHPLPPVGDGGKDERGRLFIVAGSESVPGSAVLCATSALRSGAGKVRLATAAGLASDIALRIPELFVIGLDGDQSGGFGSGSLPEVRKQAGRADAVVAGPGMERAETLGELARALLETGVPLVLDAAMLHVLRPLAPHCRAARQPLLLLPHSGEMASLLGCSEEETTMKPVETAQSAASDYGAFVLAKGSTSHVAAPDGRVWTYRGGAPGLGVAGSGDALAGIVGALLARGAEPLTALLWGVLLHGEAGEALARKIGPVGFLAREIPDEIPALLAR